MARVCMRPGCDRPAEVRLSYDTVSCQVWLDPILDRPGPVQEICEFHALRLTVPRGWLLCERRVPNPALFVPADAPEKVVPPNVSTGPDLSTGGNRSGLTVPLTVGAPSPRVGRRSPHKDAVQVKRRHPNETARELFPDDLVSAESAQPVVPPGPAERPEPADQSGQTDQSGQADWDDPAGAGDVGGPAGASDVGGPAGAGDVGGPAGAGDVGGPAGAGDVGGPAGAGDVDVPAGAGDVDVPAGAGDAEDDAPDSDEKKDTLKPTSPLLARAFAQTGPQRSVLSEDLRVPDQERPRRNNR
ncbi:MAG: DUF3499 family protein [Microthrixaceae bacterium]